MEEFFAELLIGLFQVIFEFILQFFFQVLLPIPGAYLRYVFFWLFKLKEVEFAMFLTEGWNHVFNIVVSLLFFGSIIFGAVMIFG